MSSFPPEAVKAIAAEVGELLKDRGETVSVAETVSGFFFWLASEVL